MSELNRTRLLGATVPLIQAPIGSATCPALAAAVCEAGGLGTLALSWSTSDQMRAAIADTKRLTSKPFAVNLVLAWPQLERARICLEEGVAALSTFWGDPAPYVRLAHGAGVPIVHTIGSVDEACQAVACGVDVIVAQGREAGGHVRGSTPLSALLRRVIDAVQPVPVVAAGGIATVEDVSRVWAAGAAGAWVGTRFLCSVEAAVDPSYQEAILAASEGDTVLTRLFNKGWDGAPHRVIENSTVRRWLDAGEPEPGTRPGEQDVVAHLPSGQPIERYSDVIPIRGAQGDLEALALYAGEGSARISAVLPAATIVAELATGFG